MSSGKIFNLQTPVFNIIIKKPEVYDLQRFTIN